MPGYEFLSCSGDQTHALQRYVVPLIAPPTHPQLEQDKAAIDEEFNKAFALIDNLASDTAELKASEAERTEKLDGTLKDIDTVITDLKSSNTKREAEGRIVADQVRELKSLVPEALQKWKANGDARLDELAQEVASLKKLLENRVGRSGGNSTPMGRSSQYPVVNGNAGGVKSGEESALASTDAVDGSSSSKDIPTQPGGATSHKKGAQGSERKAAIPAWQMAASKRNEDANA